jgi:molecular chaperone GrpE
VNRKPEADLASTDMSAEPSSRDESTQPEFAPSGADGSAVERELHELKDRHLRLAAEFDNYRKRVARERSELTDRAQATFIARLLEVLDDLDRLAAAGTERSPEAYNEAVDLIDRKLRKELEAAGVERVDPVGQPFNPEEQEAVSVIPAPDAAQASLVSATFQTGYRFKGALVRPARVQVYSDPSQA